MKTQPQAEPSIRRLYKSRRDRIIAGVCGGIAEYFQIDVVIVRIACVLTVFLHGIGLLAYLLALFVVPSAPEPSQVDNTKTSKIPQSKGSEHSTKNTAFYLGVFLIGLGTLFLLKEWTRDWIDPIRFRWNWDWTWGRFWPLLLVVLGSVYLAETIRKKPKTEHDNGKKTLYRTQKSKVLAGVCGGIAAYFQVDAAFIRIALVVIAVTTSVTFWIVAYAVSSMFLPIQNGGEPAAESK